MNKAIKRFASVILLIIAVSFSAHEMQDIFFNFARNEPQMLKAFYLEEKDSLDMVVLGSSDIKLGYSAPLLYKETGLTSYPYCFSVNPVTLWKYELADIERYQSPSVIVVEINGSLYKDDEHIHSKGAFYKLIQCMPMSLNKYRMAKEQSPKDDSLISNMFPFVRYHSQWHDSLSNNYYKERILIRTRGYSVLKGTETPLDVKEITYDANYPMDNLTEDLNPDGEASLRDFLESCKSAKTPNILFIQYPQLLVSEKSYARHKRSNRVGEIIREYGFEYIDFNTMPETVKMNPDTDFYDAGHLNAYGQKKFTSFLGDFIKEKYDMKPRPLTDKQKRKWAESVKYINNFYKFYNDYKKNGDNDNATTPNLRESVKYVKLLKNYE